jgi:hypothetical protein
MLWFSLVRRGNRRHPRLPFQQDFGYTFPTTPPLTHHVPTHRDTTHPPRHRHQHQHQHKKNTIYWSKDSSGMSSGSRSPVISKVSSIRCDNATPFQTQYRNYFVLLLPPALPWYATAPQVARVARLHTVIS